MRAGPSQEEIRRHNLGVLLRTVHVRGATSRAELTTRLGLNRSTIGALTSELAGAGLVREELPGAGSPVANRGAAAAPGRAGGPGGPSTPGRAGRPSLLVWPESERVCALAFAIEVDRVVAARVGLGCQVLDRRESPRLPGRLAVDEVIAPLLAFARNAVAAMPADGRLVGCGVAVSAMIRQDDGRVRLGAYGGSAEDPLGTALAEALTGALGQPVTVRNIADLAVLAEHTRGVAVGCDNVVYLHGDGGVGGGIIAAGRPVTGHRGYGGEVGHMVVNPAGRACGCGSRGCWETEIGEHALLAAAGRDLAAGAWGREAITAVIEAAARGDARAKAGLSQVGDWLGFGVANLVNIFNPEMVVFGDTIRDVYLAAAAQVRSRLNRVGLPACREHVRLRTAALGADAALLGAAELAFERLLADPLEVVA